VTEWVALLRGVNVGGVTIRSEELASAVRSAGLDDVRTVLASGNVLFTTPDAPGTSAAPDVPGEPDAAGGADRDAASGLRARLEAALSDRFAYEARVFVAPRSRVVATIDAYPFEELTDRQAYVVVTDDADVLEDLLAAMAEAVRADRTATSFEPGTPALDDVDRVARGDGVAYWSCPKGASTTTPVAKVLTRARFRTATTTRNLATLRKLV